MEAIKIEKIDGFDIGPSCRRIFYNGIFCLQGPGVIEMKKVQFVCDILIDEMLHPELVKKILETPGSIKTLKVPEFKVVATTISSDNPDFATVELIANGEIKVE